MSEGPRELRGIRDPISSKVYQRLIYLSPRRMGAGILYQKLISIAVSWLLADVPPPEPSDQEFGTLIVQGTGVPEMILSSTLALPVPLLPRR